MEFQGFGRKMDVIEWLDHEYVHKDITADVIRKRVKCGWKFEKALTYPVIKKPKQGEAKARRKKRLEKVKERKYQFERAQDIRRDYVAGLSIADLCEKYKLKKGKVYKVLLKYEWYNKHWELPTDKHIDLGVKDQIG